jgi:hypothetical protein
MTEKQLTADLRKELDRPGWLVLKHADKSTVGIPDLSVSGAGRVVWIEVKYVRPDSSVEREVTKHPAQWANMRLLEHATARKAFYVVYEEREPRKFTTSLWLPSELEREFARGVAWPVAKAWFPGKAHAMVAHFVRGGRF